MRLDGTEARTGWTRGVDRRTNNMACAFCRAALVFLFPRVMSLSAIRWASLARGHVVRIDSVSMRDVTRLRRRAMRSRLKW